MNVPVIVVVSLAAAVISTLLAYLLSQLPDFGPKSVPAKIGLVIVLTVLAGLTAAKISTNSNTPPGSGAGVDPTTTTSQPSNPPATGNGTTPPDADAANFDNDIRLPKSLLAQTDLDLDPPRGNSGFGTEDVWVSAWNTSVKLSTSEFVHSGTWNNTTDPTRDQCDYAAETMGNGVGADYSNLNAGDALCLFTDQKHVVFLRITSVDDNGIVAHAVRWN